MPSLSYFCISPHLPSRIRLPASCHALLLTSSQALCHRSQGSCAGAPRPLSAPIPPLPQNKTYHALGPKQHDACWLCSTTHWPNLSTCLLGLQSPCWDKNTFNSSDWSPKRGCSPKRLKRLEGSGFPSIARGDERFVVRVDLALRGSRRRRYGRSWYRPVLMSA